MLTSSRQVTFSTRGLTKVYGTGDVAVHALRGIDLELEAIETANRELGTTSVVITHNAVIADMADRVIDFADGRIHSLRENTHKRRARELVW